MKSTTKILVLALCVGAVNEMAWGQGFPVEGDFRSRQSGNWDDNKTWERFSEETSRWVWPAPSIPSFKDRRVEISIYITGGEIDTVRVTSSTSKVEIDELTVRGVLEIHEGGVVIVARKPDRPDNEYDIRGIGKVIVKCGGVFTTNGDGDWESLEVDRCESGTVTSKATSSLLPAAINNSGKIRVKTFKYGDGGRGSVGAINNFGEITISNMVEYTGGGSVTGNPFRYTGGELMLTNPAGNVIDSNNAFWPETNGPADVYSRGPLTMNVTRTLRGMHCYPTSPLILNAPLTVNYFSTSAHVTNAHNLTADGSLFTSSFYRVVIDSGGSFDSSPTYVGDVTLVYEGSHDVGPEWGSGTSVGVGVPPSVSIRGTVNMPSGPRRCPQGLSIHPNGTLRLSAASGASLSVGGGWSNQGVFIHNSQEVVFDKDLTGPYLYPQDISGSTTFADLTINTPLGIRIGDTDTIRVDQTLRFVTGNLRIIGSSWHTDDPGTLILSGDVIGASPTQHIVTEMNLTGGRVVRTIAASDSFQFPIGGSDTTYNPVTIALAPGDPAETFSVYVQDYLTPEPPIYPYQALNREWRIDKRTEGGNNATLKFYWNAGDRASSEFDPGSGIAIGRHNGFWWTNTIATYNAGPPRSAVASFPVASGTFAIGNSGTFIDRARANVFAYLEGPYNPDTYKMNNQLKTSGLLAARFPGAPIPTNAVDSVSIEIRNAAMNPTMRKFQPAWLLTDGSIRAFHDTTKRYVEFDTLAGNYYLAVHHRNHLPIMSIMLLSLSSIADFYDFTSAQSSAYGTNPMKQVGTTYCMYAGDGDGGGGINALDRNLIWRPQNGSLGYFGGDFDLSGGVNATDRNIFWRPNNGTVTQVP